MAWHPELARRGRTGIAHGRVGYVLVIAGWVASLVSGCTVGPDYVKPKTDMPAMYVTQADVTTGSRRTLAAADNAWWKNFNDPILYRLDDEALRSAPDLAVAKARVLEARALRGIAGAAQSPEVDIDAGYDRTHGSANVPVGVPPGGLGPGIDGNLWQAGFDASWEIDVFGGTRRNIQVATASYQAAVQDRGDVLLTVLAEIARNYIELRGAQQRMGVSRDNLAIQLDTLTLTRAQFEAGLASQLDVLRAQALVAQTQAAIPEFEIDERVAIYRIGALVGRPPADFLAELNAPQPIPSPVADVPIGLPSDLLKRRPDIRAAERRLAAANARIGVAEADLYPHFLLTGGTGVESLDASSFLAAPSHYFSIGPRITWRIFDAGKVRFTIQAEQARTDQAAASYQRTVLNALLDVEAALISYSQTRVRREHLAAEAAANRDAVSVATRLFRQGLTDFLSVLDAERSLYAAQDKLAQTDRDTALALITLYKSLGGGWQVDDPSTALVTAPQ